LDTPQVDWLSIVSEAYKNSTTYLDANYRKVFERNVANFRSTHPAGSKYHTDAYKFRSRLFRPKTRSAIRRAEASFAEAAFATTDIISLSPVDQADKDEDKRSELWQAVLNHRLVNSIPWFLTCIGAFQESKVYGVVCSRQDWEYEQIVKDIPGIDPITQAEMTQQVVEVVTDRPRVKLIEIENIRFDPGADWTDPVNSSPYFIELMPMYVGDVLAKMDQDEGKTGEPAWTKLERGEVLAAGRPIDIEADSTRSAREGGKQDPKDTDTRTKEFEIVWVFRVFIRKDGQDHEFYTLTDKVMLTEPAPPTSPLGRPYRIGISTIEAHRAIPSGDVELGQQIQAEINDTVNQRLDNVKLVLNKGKFVRRDAGTDLMTLKRSYPGRIVMTKDPQKDIVEEVVRDVTASSYAEQDRLNSDMDDLTGGFSQGSVATSRNLNETVGGMQMMQQSGNAVSSYSVRTFCETWVEPVLKDIVKLIQVYENDAIIQKFAQTVGVQLPDRQSITAEMNVNVSVGFGPLDPKAKVGAIVQSLQALGQVVPWLMEALDGETIAREVFGAIGFRNGVKFFREIPKGPQQQSDPRAEMMGQEIQMKMQMMQAEMQAKQQQAQMDAQIAMAQLQLNREAKMAELALKSELTMAQLYAKLDLDMDKLNLNILQEMTRREEISAHREEMLLKEKHGSGV
jgi:hypothetical protein